MKKILMFLFIAMLFVSCNKDKKSESKSPESNTQENKSVFIDNGFLAIGGGPSGGVFNIVATGIANILHNSYPEIVIDVQPGGSGPNILRVGGNQTDMGLTSASNAWDAWYGRDPATPENPIQNIRGLMTVMQSAIQIFVDANSDIYSLGDLKGKQVSAGQPGQTSWLAFQRLLKVHGMTMEDIETKGGKMQKLSWGESHNAIRNGQIDAIVWLSLYPHPTVREDETARPIRTLSFDENKLEEFIRLSGGGFEVVTLPKGLYGGQNSPATTVGTSTFLFASESMSENVAEAIVKELWDNVEDFKSIHSLLGGIAKDNIGFGMGIPLHPGAKKFYEKNGIPFSDISISDIP